MRKNKTAVTCPPQNHTSPKMTSWRLMAAPASSLTSTEHLVSTVMGGSVTIHTPGIFIVTGRALDSSWLPLLYGK